MSNKRLLICIDGSEIADAAFNYGMEHIYRPGDKVFFLKVAEYDVSFQALGSDWQKVCDTVKQHEDAIDEMYSRYTTLLRKYNAEGEGLRPRGGKVGEVICKTAQDNGIQHIVMGSRGLGKFQRAFIGSVSNYVLNHADIPVTVIPKHK